MNNYQKKEATRITWVGFFANLVLTIFKLIAGVAGQSAAMVADAAHSVSDFATDLVVVGSLKVSARPKDGNHKYGHGKVETLATAFVGGVLVIVGLSILISGAVSVYKHFFVNPIEQPEYIALIAAIVSILVKEILYQYTIRIADRINSKVVLANAWHHRSDAFSSIGTVMGIGGAIFLGPAWAVLDPMAAMIVSLFILRVAKRISWDSLAELVETSLPKHFENEIIEIAQTIEGVHLPHDLKTRKIGNDIAIDLHIYVNRHLNIEQAHEITVDLENCLRKKFGDDTHISIHTEPLIEPQ